MPVCLFRIDDRLVHGQVVEGWLPELGATEMLVVSEEIAGDPTRQAIMRFATPEGVALKVMKPEDAAKYIAGAAALPQKILVLLPGLVEALFLLKAGVSFGSLNVGGMHYSAGKNLSVGRAIFLSDEDLRGLKALAASGVRLEGRGVPSDKPMDLIAALG